MADFSHTDAVILAGGLGTRLRPVVSDRPKALALVRGRPFLLYLLDWLASWGLERVVLCTGYLGGMVRQGLGKRHGPLRLAYSQEAEPLGTGGALRLALPLLDSETILVANGDSYCPADLAALWKAHQRIGAQATLALTVAADSGRFGRVEVDAAGVVRAFTEKTPGGEPGLVNAGVYMLQRSLLAGLPGGRALSLEREVFPQLIGRGLYGWPCGQGFLDIGTPESFALAQEELA